MATMNNIGNKISARRKELNWSQEEAAKYFNVTQQTISKWEVGRVEPDRVSWERIAKFLGCEIIQLIAEERSAGNMETIEKFIENFVPVNEEELKYLGTYRRDVLYFDIFEDDLAYDAYMYEKDSSLKVHAVGIAKYQEAHNHYVTLEEFISLLSNNFLSFASDYVQTIKIVEESDERIE